MYSPSPSSLLSRHFTAYTSILRITGIAATAALALLFLVSNVPSASAQTRARRALAESAKSSRRVEDKKRADEKQRVEDKRRAENKRRTDDKRRAAAPVETARRDSIRQPTANPLTRKTALTYAPKTVGEPAKRPALVNDVIVVSRASEKPASPVLLPTSSKVVSANIPSIWPVMGTLRSGVGTRSNPFGGSSIEFHKGQDIAAPIGTPVIATADGTVVIAGWLRGYGWVVYIDHGNGITTRYGHLSRIDVTVGQPLKRGEQLGLVGSTGRSTGPHLHYEVRVNGLPVSPLLYLPPMTATAQR